MTGSGPPEARGGPIGARRGRPVVAFLPPACCGAGYFRRLGRLLADHVDVRPVELPGRGRRYREPVLTAAEQAARDLAERTGPGVDAIYGESLGAYLGLAVVALGVWRRPPVLLAASNSPPSVRAASGARPRRVTSTPDAIAALRDLGGDVPADVLRDPALAARAYLLFRGDLRLSWSLIAFLRDVCVTGDITVLAGADDAALTGLSSWSAHTSGRCEVVAVPGGHLLSASNPTGVADAVLRVLRDG